jgi:hypothetical protein
VPDNTSPAQKSNADLDLPIWGATAIAEVLNVPVRRSYWLLENKLVPAERVGRRWVSTRRRLLTRIVGAA